MYHLYDCLHLETIYIKNECKRERESINKNVSNIYVYNIHTVN